MNLVTDLAPGVYHEWADRARDRDGLARTDVAGFAGIAERGPVGTAVPLESWRQYNAWFGVPVPGAFLGQSIRAFFENGGRRCWAVRVADLTEAAASEATIADASGLARWTISASSTGTWGDGLSIRLDEVRPVSTTVEAATSTPEALSVRSTLGFERGMLVELRRSGLAPESRIVNQVDPSGRLVLVPVDPADGLATDRRLDLSTTPGMHSLEAIEYRVLVRNRTRILAQFDRLALSPASDRYGPRVLTTTEAGFGPPPPVLVSDIGKKTVLSRLQESNGWVTLAGGADGLSTIRAGDYIGEPAGPADDDQVRALKRQGLASLAEVDEVCLVSIPDVHARARVGPRFAPLPKCRVNPCFDVVSSPVAPTRRPAPPAGPRSLSEAEVSRVQQAMVDHCELLGDRVALLDPPLGPDTTRGADEVLSRLDLHRWRHEFDSSFAAAYAPWVVVGSSGTGAVLDGGAIPPSGPVCGLIGATERRWGVHRAPANVSLEWVHDVTSAFGADTHAALNEIGVNVVRPTPRSGIRVLGARTCSSDSALAFLNVRRLLISIERRFRSALQWAVFEPNNDLTHEKIRLSIGSYLLELFAHGALAGATAAEAFRVHCDDMDWPDNRRNGRLLAEVLVAPSIPLEFVRILVGRVDNELEVQTVGTTTGVLTWR